MRIKCYGNCYKCFSDVKSECWSFSYIGYKGEIKFENCGNYYTLGCSESMYEQYILFPESLTKDCKSMAIPDYERIFVMHSIELAFQLFGVSYVLFVRASFEKKIVSDTFAKPIDLLPFCRPSVRIGFFCRYVDL